MAKAFSIILLLCFIGLTYYEFYQINPVAFGGKQKFFQNITGDPLNGINGSITNLANNLPISPSTGLTALGLGAFVVLTIVFPNPFTLFAVFAAGMLTFYFAIGDLTAGAGVGTQITFLFDILGLALLLAIMGWYKGNE